MPNISVDVTNEADGSLVVQPHGAMDSGSAESFRQVLVHAVRRVRPLTLVLDLTDVSDVDSINVGVLAALCYVAEEQRFVVFIQNPSPAITIRLLAAGVPAQRLTRR